MYRQPSFRPDDLPRAAPPLDAVPVSITRTPTDGRPVVSPAYGDKQVSRSFSRVTLSSREPDLPPPNLSDNARFQAAPPSVDALRPPVSLSDTTLVSGGRTLFLNRCVQCHSPTGYGVGVVGLYLVPAPPDLAAPLVQTISDGAIFWHVTMGQGKMPGFRHWTTPGERWALTAYVRSLKGAKREKNRDGAAAWAQTQSAPYPVYGARGYENGQPAHPFKVLDENTGKR